jgi:hypothetical protein
MADDHDESYLQEKQSAVQLGACLCKATLQSAQVLVELRRQWFRLGHRMLQRSAPFHQILQLIIALRYILFQSLIKIKCYYPL